MQYGLFLFIITFACNGALMYASDAQPYRTALSKPNSLAGYIINWPSLIQELHKKAASGVIIPEGISHGTQITFQPLVWIDQHHKIAIRKDTTQYPILQKKDGNAKIVYQDFTKAFTAAYVPISRIAYFLCPSIVCAMREVSLEHTNLSSFEEVQAAIIAQCPSLEKLNLNHNKLQGAVYLLHSNISAFTATHNNFSSLGEIRLPKGSLVDLRYNPTLSCLNAPEASVKIGCLFLIDHPETQIESMTIDL